MATDDGTAARPGLPLSSETDTPPCGAGPFRKTFPLTVAPPGMNWGTLSPDSDGGNTVIGWFRVTALPEAEIVLTVLAATAVVAMLKKAEVVPAGALTAGGGAATPGRELDRETLKGDVVIAFSVALPLALLPPTAAV